MSMHAIILAGGRGERFWPLSRRSRPKQLLPLVDGRSLLQMTADRIDGWISPERWWIVAGAEVMQEIRRQIPSLDAFRCIVEPVARNTAAAIGAAAAAVETVDPGAVLLVLPSDHWIPDLDLFREDAARASASARATGGLHLFGVPPLHPETGYGYIERGEEVAGLEGTRRVVRFHEKPDPERAIAYAARPEMLWNSGIFVWSAAAILDAMRRWIPRMDRLLADLAAALADDPARARPETMEAVARYFIEAPSESIDTAVLEKHEATFVAVARFRWSDLGTWAAWGERLPADANGLRSRGKILADDAHDCIAYSEGGLLALLGVRDLIVVRLNDVTLVCDRRQAQEVRRLVRWAAEQGDLEEYL